MGKETAVACGAGGFIGGYFVARVPAEVPEISNHWKFPRAQVPVIGKNRMNVF